MENVPINEKIKPAIRDARRTRARILNAAIRLFSDRGLAGTSVDDIADKARINKRMLYHYFGNKQGLYLAVLENVYQRIRSISLEIIAESQNIGDLLRGLINEYFTFLRTNPEFVALLNWENSQGATGLKLVDMDSVTQPFISAIQEALTQEKLQHAIRDDVDIKFLIMTCISLCGYYFSNQQSLSVVFGMNLDDPVQMDRWVEHITQLITRGVTSKV